MSAKEVNWNSPDSGVFLNPSLDKHLADDLHDLEKKFRKPYHLWVATSGSTTIESDYIKLVAISKSACIASAEAVNKFLAIKTGDVWFNALPEFHIAGISIYARAALSGSKVIKLNEGKWNATRFHQELTDAKAAWSSLVPTQLYDICHAQLGPTTSLKGLIIGGGTLTKSLLFSARKLGWPLIITYGCTECASQIATSELSDLNPMPEMKVLPHLQVKSCDGFLSVKGQSLFTGYAYFNDGRMFFTDPKKDGWFQSEDRVDISGDRLKYLGRSGDIITVYGESVNLYKLEEIFNNLKAASETSMDSFIVGIPDDRKGFEITLVIEGENRNINILEKFNNSVLPFERITRVKFIRKFPRTTLGKIQKKLVTEISSE